jgi:two-component system, chemotaxis family, protein-glutamate methylesterase/glutaminase
LRPEYLVVVGASAGGIEALKEVLGHLPKNLPATVLVVQHSSSRNTRRLLLEVLGYFAALPLRYPEDREAMETGYIYLAPPDFHMTVEEGRLRVLQGPREKKSRPAIDPLFRTAVDSYGSRVLGLVLTGLLDDGAVGLMTVRAHGGQAIVQDPETAMFPAMPQSALDRVPDATVLSLSEIAPAIERLAWKSLLAPPRHNNPQSGPGTRDGEPASNHSSA